MAIKNFSPYEIVKEALDGLREKERYVVAGRFGIDTAHKTLSSIGKELKLSRERVRQIEKDALKKVASKILDQRTETIAKIIEVFEKNGGLTHAEKISEKFLEDAHRGQIKQYNSLNLIFFVMPQLKKIKKTRELEEGWILAKLSRSEAVKVINEWANHLKKVNRPQSLEVLVNAHPHHTKYDITFLTELPSISKKVIITEDGNVGLANWSEINPKNIRDKIFYILKKYGKPMHFGDIAKRIEDQSFDKKSVVKATVHNELIADDRFVLVGRGIYALKEWGYQNGTVADIIIGILGGQSKPMTAEEIIKEVLKQRIVKKNTVLINLKTKPQFKRVGEDAFSLA